MLDNKIPTPVTTWPQEQFFNLAPILTHQMLSSIHVTKIFRVKTLAKFQFLTDRS